jgi:hypothetical protein
MGYYVNTGCDKQDWLENNGHRISPRYINKSTGSLAVYLVNNGPFTAAGVCHREDEFEAFNDKSDERYKVWYSVPLEKLLEVVIGLESIL